LLLIARHAANVKSEPIDTHLQSGLKSGERFRAQSGKLQGGWAPPCQPATSSMLNLKVVSSLPFSFFFLVLTPCATLTFLSHFAPIVARAESSQCKSFGLALFCGARASSFDQKRKVFSDCVHIPFEFFDKQSAIFLLGVFAAVAAVGSEE